MSFLSDIQTILASMSDVVFKSALRSKPVRENFETHDTALETIAARIDAIEAAATADQTVEVTEAREGATSLLDNLRAQRALNVAAKYIAITGLRVTQTTVASMAVSVTAGNGIVNNTGVVNAGGDTSTVSAAASGYHRYDAVVINTAGTIVVKTGDEVLTSETRNLPSVLASEMLLAYFGITESTTSITDSDIVDMRINVQNGAEPAYHVWFQSQFEDLFGDGTTTSGYTNAGFALSAGSDSEPIVTIPAGTVIYLHACQGGGTTDSWNGTVAYIQKTVFAFGSNITIFGDGENTCGIVKDTSSSYASYLRFDVTGSSNIEMRWFYYDGRGNVNSLGGSIISGYPLIYASSIANHITTPKLINNKNIIKTEFGGGAVRCNYSTIKIYSCSAMYGDGAYACNNSKIVVYGCSGYIAYECYGCESIWGDYGNIYNCTLGGVRLGNINVANTGSSITTGEVTDGYVSET